MPTSPFTLRDRSRLVDVHFALVSRIETVFGAMADSGHRMMVTAGVRTVAQQQALYAQGRTVPGLIVTNKDGITYRSDHQPHADGYGYAVDCAFDDPKPFDASHPWEMYGRLVEAQGLTWGGRWSHPHDAPHAELLSGTRRTIVLHA